ncbi:MAG TPA: DUF4173 domain-containing protein, partial [Candidatus Dormibacteraeota bacterium]|nr:DUF4173 domain-containing protein [Candidatus Dormibacteraeota bacterium]
MSSYIGQVSADGMWRWDGASWQPIASSATHQPGPSWLNLNVKATPTWLGLAGTLIVGLIADQALRTGTFGLAASLTVAAGALFLVFTGRLLTLESRLLAGAAVLFGAWLSARASAWLLWPDLGMAFALLGLAASVARSGSLLDTGIAEAAARSVHAFIHGVGGAAFMVRPLRSTRDRLTLLGPLARGLLIAAPIAILLAGMLAAADPVFASFFNLNVDLGQLVRDAVFVLVGSLTLAGLLRLAAAEPVSRVNGPVWRLGSIEGLVVLAVLDAIFAAFAVAQAIAATGAAGDTLRAAGMTYADYARSGFFELLWVAGITAVILILFSRITSLTQPNTKRAFLVLGQIGIGLTVLIVFVAFRRLSLYEDAYGFTMLRVYSHIFAVWIAVVFLLLAADMAGVFRKHRWFVGATSLSAMAVLLALNLVNPEAVVVGLNIDHARSAHKVDAQYLAELSSDATPTLLASRSQLDAALGVDISRVACAGPKTYSVNPSAFNWSAAAAAAARRQA